MNNLFKIVLCSVALMPIISLAQEQEDKKKFNTCLSELRSVAISNGVKEESYNKYTSNLTPLMSVIPSLNKQPEFTFSPMKYINSLVSNARISKGRGLFEEHKETLEKISLEYGVPPSIVVSVWGVESYYGTRQGTNRIVQSLATLSCFGRRQEYFKKELFSSLRILQEGHFKEEDFKGSWAGAFGHTQFMPTTFEKIAVDFDKDGKKDLIFNSKDALASTANFLKSAGWKKDLTWGYEVKIPSEVTTEGRKDKHNVKYWKDKGVTLSDGSQLPHDMPETGLIITEKNGLSFLVTKNFEAIYRYNASESYALAIGRLSEMIIKKGNIALEDFQTTFEELGVFIIH